MQPSPFLVLAIAAAVTAIPSPDAYDVVPETAFEQYMQNTESDYANAQKSVQSLMETGKSDKECRDLATASKKAIEDDVKADQKILDAIPTGDSCKNEGQSLVASNKNSLSKANDDEKAAKKKLDKAAAANVDFGTIPYNQLVPGQCGTFFNHPGYKSAKAALDKAKADHDKAKGATVAAQKAYDQAVAAAADSKAKCLCSAKKAHDKAWDQVKSTKHKAALDWKTAHNVECVLDGTPVSKCKVPAEPKVKAPKLNADAAKMDSTKCDDGAMGTTTTLYSKCSPIDGKQLQYLDRTAVQCGANQALTSFTLNKGSCTVKNDMQYIFGCGNLKLGAATAKYTGCTPMSEKDDQYLDQQNLKCGSGEVMTGFALGRWNCNDNNGKLMRYRYYCAKPHYKTLGKETTNLSKCTVLQGKQDQYLDRQKPKCPTGSAITGFALTRKGCADTTNDLRYETKCADA